MAEFERSREEIETSLNRAVNRTLGDIDVHRAFDKTRNHPKVTGIAGDVVEQSVLGYPANSSQEPDLSVDGTLMEVKTTGIRYTKKSLKKKHQTDKDFEAKEPMTVTAVSPKTILKEDFDDSNFWHKLNHLLMIYYHYDSSKPVKSWEYKDFYVKGFDFHQFSDSDRKRLEGDWTKVKDFIAQAQNDYPENPEERYPYLGSSLRKDLLMIDTAPKWPNSPRFRLKRSVVTSMVQEHFSKKKYEVLSQELNTSDEMDTLLRKCTEKYQGMSIRELIEELNVPVKLNKNNDVTKSIGEPVFLKMIHAKSKKMNNVDVFRKAGITLKTIVETSTGKRTEDMKMFPIAFSEIGPHTKFEDSQFYTYFSESQFIFIQFRENDMGPKLLDNEFIGFKRLAFDDNFIDDQVHTAWRHTKKLYVGGRIKATVQLNAAGAPIINKSGVPRVELNFIKSKDNDVFVRGGGTNAKAGKTHTIQGISMYQQFIWVKGSYLVDKLKSIAYI